MQIFLIFLAAVLMSAQGVFQKQYNIKTKSPNVFLFTMAVSLAALVFFVVSSGFSLNFTISILPYSVGFAVSYAAATCALVYAVRCGSLAITNLILSYSLIIPTLYGIIFLKDNIGFNTYIGIALLLISLFMLNKKDSDEKVNFSVKWLVFALISFVGNGMCSTVQKIQQMKFEGAYKSEFMIVALLIVSIIMFIGAIVQGNIKKEIKGCVKYATACGIANGGVNLLVMILSGLVPNAILFPTLSAGGIVLSFIIAVFIYKEKLSKVQLVGYLVGIVSVILLNV